MKIEDFVIVGNGEAGVDMLCPDPAGTCPQPWTEAGGTLGSAIEAAHDHIQRLHPSQVQCSLERRGVCTACGDEDETTGSDGRCHRCQRNGNPAHSWCSHRSRK